MGTFLLTNIKRQYSTGDNDDVISKFYNPVLSQAVTYDRAAGFFGSSVLLSYILGLEKFVTNNGHIRLVISPFVSQTDAMAFIEANKQEVFQETNKLFAEYKSDKKPELAAKILVALIEDGTIDIRFVVLKTINGLYHPKIGIFTDDGEAKIAINGSNNETSAALTTNFETFSVFCSWKQGQNDYVKDVEQNFEDIWNNDNDSNYVTKKLEEAVDLGIFDSLRTSESVSELYAKIKKADDNNTESSGDNFSVSFTPYDYQENAAQKWITEHRGIVSFATGTGKTKTALLCMKKFSEKFGPSFFVVIVPDKTLNNQWASEIKNLGINTVQCFSENNDWQLELRDDIEHYKIVNATNVVVVVTNSTMQKAKFQRLLKMIPKGYMLIGDECHHLGTMNSLNALPNTEYRLGLSATPFVYGDDGLTSRLQQYFGGIIADYPLKDAITDGRLTQYRYHPVIVSLSDNEVEAYRNLSSKIAKFEAKKQSTKLTDSEQQQEEMLLFKRARIVYSAESKLVSLKQILHKENLQEHLLIYCGVTSASEISAINDSDQIGLNQLEAVNKILSNDNIAYAQYTRNENGKERINRIDDFKNGTIRVLTAIRCLDEGVDIPEIRSAIILASSGNPREFVQRRGRLLRLYPGKDIVDIYDMVVLDDELSSLNVGELKRVREFASCAANQSELDERFGSLFGQYLEDKNE